MIRTFFIYCIVLLALLQVTSSSNFFNRNFKSSAPESSSSSNQDDDYYKILGLPRSASEREVKTAYRKRAMVMHPDKGGNEEEFKRLVEAYEVLSDQAKRKLYDKYGSKGLDGKSGFTDPSYMNNDFRDFFRGFSSFPVIYNLEIDLEDFFKGRSLTIVLQNEKFAVEIEPGMYEGTEIRGQIIDAAGNSKQIVLILQEKPHPLFRRKNADLYIECTISISEVLLGFERTLTHLDGSQFIIKSKEGELVAPEEVLVIEQLGMPIYKSNGRKQKVVERGRLFIKVKVEIPSKLSFTPEERQTLDKIFANKQNRSFQTSFIANKKKSSIPQFVPTKSDLRKFGGLGSYARDEETDDFTDFGSFFFR